MLAAVHHAEVVALRVGEPRWCSPWPSGTRQESVVFNAEGSGAALATVATLSTLGLVVPAFTTSSPGPVFSPPQLAFAAITALALYGLFVALQTVRHRDYFLPVTADGEVIDADHHATPPSTRAALISLALLLVAWSPSLAMRSWCRQPSSEP